MDKFNQIFSLIVGEKKFQIIKFLCENADEDGFISLTILQICDQTNSSKPTVINTIKLLEQKSILKRIKNGFYKLLI